MRYTTHELSVGRQPCVVGICSSLINSILRNMKLHLPKLLSVAVMSALTLPTMGAVLTSANVVTPVEGGDSYLNVGTEVDVDTWSGDLVIGDTSESTGDVDNVGAFNDDWDWVAPNKTVLTSELKVQGNITVQGNGKVVLGGYFSDTRYMGLEATVAAYKKCLTK